MHPYRTHDCGALREANIGETVRLAGWIHRKRDHGNLLFVDLRDHYGITQCVIDSSAEIFAEVESARLEYVVTMTGEVVARSEDTINPRLPTGHVELKIASFAVLSVADPLPLQVNSDMDYGEDTRLKYRFLDLRREKMQRNMILRADVIASIRRRLTEAGFREFQTPILTASSPEGARDYLVPSRIHPGRFYALPQAPQQFKQLLMIAGPTARRASSTSSTSRCRSAPRTTCSARWSRCWPASSRNSEEGAPSTRRRSCAFRSTRRC